MADMFPDAIVPLAPRPESYTFLWSSSLICVLVAVWSGLRFWSRKLRRLPLVLEDMLYYISVGSFYVFVVALYMAVYLGGAGYHISDLNKFHIARLSQSFLVIQAAYGFSMCACKWSMLFMLKRIFVLRYFKIITWIIIGLQAGWLIMTILIGFLICTPVQKNWDPTADGTCGDRVAGYSAVSIINVIIDVIMLVLPLPMVFNLQVKAGYKVGLFSIFGIGIVTVIFSVIRLDSLKMIDWSDFSYTIIPVMTWTLAENGVIIMVASSALLRPVFDRIFGHVLSLAGTKKTSNLSGGDRLHTFGQSTRSRSGLSRVHRKEFYSVNDEGTASDDFHEMGTVGPRTEITVGGRHSQGNLLDTVPREQQVAPKDSSMTGIKVKSTVTQTFTER